MLAVSTFSNIKNQNQAISRFFSKPFVHMYHRTSYISLLGVVTTVKGGCYNCQKMKQKIKVSELIPKQLKMSKYQSIKNISVLFLLWPNYRTGPLLRRFFSTVQMVQRSPAVVFVAAFGGALQVEIGPKGYLLGC